MNAIEFVVLVEHLRKTRQVALEMPRDGYWMSSEDTVDESPSGWVEWKHNGQTFIFAPEAVVIRTAPE